MTPFESNAAQYREPDSPAAAADDTTATQQTLNQQDSRGLLNSTVMMVDDEPLNMEVIQMFLEEAGYKRFVTASDSTRAIDLMLQNQPDIVLLDLQMPDVSGFDIMQAMAKHEDLRHIPVLILTSASDPQVKLEALEMGATDFLGKPVDPSELALRMKNTLSAKAYQDQLAYYDSLTGLPNRDMFLSRLGLLMKQNEESGYQVSVLHIGLKRYQQIVDTLGPSLGDDLIRQAARSIEQTLRRVGGSANTEGQESWRNLARLGGSEFAVAISGLGTMNLVQNLAKEIQSDLDQAFHSDGQEVFVAPVVGIGVYPQDGNNQDTLMKHAGVALNHASHDEGEPIRFYASELNARARQNLLMEGYLRKALELSQLKLYYQPKVDPMSGRICGAEALLRWIHPELGLVNPLDFIPMAEETGLIIGMGEWILQEACRQTRAWIDAGHQEFVMSINVSAKQFQGDELLDVIRSAMDRNRLAGANVTLELTESMLMKNPAENIARLKQIRDMGVRLSIDDFGTGYSSLNYLKKFPISELKIDYSFMRGVHKATDDAAIVGAIFALAHALKLRVVAEGVEVQEQLDFIRGYDCELCQGFMFSPPVPADEFEAMLNSTEALPGF